MVVGFGWWFSLAYASGLWGRLVGLWANGPKLWRWLMSELLLRELLPIKLTNGNDGRGSRWFKADKRRKAIVKQLGDLKREPFGVPVRVVITRVLGKGERLWDADSVGRGNAKELIDSLVELGWWVDDGPKFIRECDYRQDAGRRDDGAAVLVEVFSL